MSVCVVDEAAHWADELMEAEWRGRRDNEGAVRYRLSRKLGIPESYLYRLQYKRGEMKDLRASVYRALILGRRLYGLACESIEASADRMRDERHQITGQANAISESPAAMAAGMARAAKGAPEEGMR